MGNEMPNEDRPEDGQTRQTYEPPILRRYGTLRDVTLHVGKHGARDGGKGDKHRKTHI
jgi:hypothetical protein